MLATHDKLDNRVVKGIILQVARLLNKVEKVVNEIVVKYACRPVTLLVVASARNAALTQVLK
jgi:hypothetical protein